MDWREFDLPDFHWAPHGVPGALRRLPGWGARLAVETRFAAEVAAFSSALARSPGRFTDDLPDGGGRGVLVIPGFGFNDASSLPLQIMLRSAGYRIFLSKILWNIDCAEATIDHLVKVAEKAVADNGGPVLVVGHSRGGMLARGLAVRRPDLVSRVIAMGSPLNYEFAFYEVPAPLVAVLQEVHQCHPKRREMRCGTPDCACDYMTAAHRPLPAGIDLVSLYSTSDGIVDWRACVVPGATNIEVPGSHLGMGLRPSTLRLILQLLADADPATADSRSPTETNR